MPCVLSTAFADSADLIALDSRLCSLSLQTWLDAVLERLREQPAPLGGQPMALASNLLRVVALSRAHDELGDEAYAAVLSSLSSQRSVLSQGCLWQCLYTLLGVCLVGAAA